MALNILIVEDEIAIAETLIYAFKEAGYETHHVLLGHDAIKLQRSSPFDFIVLDVGLPDLSGFDVCRQIRQHWQVPILFLTARNHEIDRIVGLEIGADDYVAKPFNPREIVARAKTILRRSQSLQKPASNGFFVDEISNRIQYQGAWLSLTRYEFLLLKTLIAQPQRIYSRDQLMDMVWQHAEDTLERTVDAHIKTLRGKLRGVNPESQAITTHRGMGYSLANI
ncbi:MAG: two-component system response regulator CreB [Methylophilaceae bacterium]|nr:two-component system response regulator CreB [Methyloradius sp.]